RLGDENKARQVLANINNQSVLRVIDAETQQYIADSMPKIKAQSLNIRYGHGVDAKIQDEYQSSYQETMLAEEVELFPAAMLGNLPPLHFLARMSGGRIIKGRLPILKAE
ncbi:MAG: conjugal transfer protein TraD, partial [Gallionella sp.]|nr:conjugal transfer protein TraD [Gallionella sp.]